uniref:Uncharacterized protein n=1 Tax=Setaria italica TaxID=4555 RepID=K3YFM2_SETIT
MLPKCHLYPRISFLSHIDGRVVNNLYFQDCGWRSKLFAYPKT